MGDSSGATLVMVASTPAAECERWLREVFDDLGASRTTGAPPPVREASALRQDGF